MTSTAFPLTPDAARRCPWLAPLARAYAAADAAPGAPPPGPCGAAPAVSPIELQGLSWFLCEVLAGPARERVKAGLREGGRAACPFLLDGACAVHAARPLACRGPAAAVGDAAAILLQFTTGRSEAECRDAARRGALAEAERPLPAAALARLADVMELHDR